MRGSIFAPILATLVGLILAAIGAEVLVRSLRLDAKNLPSWNDRPRDYFYPEGAKSLLGQMHQATKPEGTLRIAVIGDSFAFGPYMQIDDTFAKRLERWLNLNQNQHHVEVVNYGVPRYSTSHEIQTTQQALDEGADLVLLQITLNDPEIKPYRPTGLIKSDRFGQPLPDSWLFRHWHTLRFFAERLENAQSVGRYRDYFFKLWNDADTFGQFQKSLKSIADLCKARQKILVAVVFPLFGFPNDDSYPFHPLHQKALGELASLRIPSLDLFETYRGIPLDRLVVLPGRDRHPNEIAHRLAAESIYSWLNKTSLLPAELFAKTRSANREGLKFEDNRTPLELD